MFLGRNSSFYAVSVLARFRRDGLDNSSLYLRGNRVQKIGDDFGGKEKGRPVKVGLLATESGAQCTVTGSSLRTLLKKSYSVCTKYWRSKSSWVTTIRMAAFSVR